MSLKGNHTACAIYVFTVYYFSPKNNYFNLMRLTCPECKNEVDLAGYPNLAVGNVIECNVCGITLLVNKLDSDTVICEVVDEGK